MIRDDEHALAVAELFTAAAVNGDWPTALNAFADACGANGAQLIGVGSDTAIPFNWMPRSDPAAVPEFLRIRGGDRSVNPRMELALTAPLMQASHDLQCSSDDELRRNFEYADYCLRYCAPYASQTVLMRDARGLIGILTHRKEQHGIAQAEDRRAFETFAPHVLAAVKLQMAVDGQGAKLMAGALDAVRAAAFICDSFGLVQALTPAAEAAVQRGPLRLKSGKLSASRPTDARALETAIGAAVSGVITPHSVARRTLIVRDANAPERFDVVEIASLPRKKFTLGFEPRAVVTIRGRPDDEAELSQLLQAGFALTSAEAGVVARLASGETRESIAAERQVSLDTVRMQIKRAFAKMNVRREAELFALIGRLR